LPFHHFRTSEKSRQDWGTSELSFSIPTSTSLDKFRGKDGLAAMAIPV
jgi:hypothetical protein